MICYRYSNNGPKLNFVVLSGGGYNPLLSPRWKFNHYLFGAPIFVRQRGLFGQWGRIINWLRRGGNGFMKMDFVNGQRLTDADHNRATVVVIYLYIDDVDQNRR